MRLGRGQFGGVRPSRHLCPFGVALRNTAVPAERALDLKVTLGVIIARLCALDRCPGLLVFRQRDRERGFRFLDLDFEGRAVERSKRLTGPDAGIVIGHQFGDLARQLGADLNRVNRVERSGRGDILNDVVAGDADIAQIITIILDR